MNGSESAIFRTKEKLYALRGQLMVDSPLLGGRAAKPLVWVPCLALALFGLWSFWHAQGLRKNEVDESVYTYIGWSWGEGYWPYLDNWDHKGPAIYLATMLRVALAGTKPEMLGLQQIAVGCATAILLAGIAYDLWGGLSPPMALAFGILIWTQSLPEFDVVATPGSLIGLFSTGAVLAALAAAHHISFRKSAVLVLLMALANGLALCTKPNAIAGSVIGLVAIWWLSEYRTPRERILLTLVAGLGTLVPILAFAIVFYFANALDALVDSYIIFNSIYSQQLLVGQSVLDLAGRAIMTLAVVGILRWRLIAAVLAVALTAVVPMRKINVKRWLIIRKGSLIIPLWLLVELGLFVSNGSWAYHVFPILPAVALGATWLVVAASRLPYLFGKACSVLIFLLLAIRLTVATGTTHPPTEAVLRRNSDWSYMVNAVADATSPGDKVLILTWDATFIMNLIHRHSVTRYIHTVPLITRGYASDQHWVNLLADIEGNPPRVILLGIFSQDMPTDAPTALDWSFRAFFRPPYDNTPYPHREQFEAFIANHYFLDRCLFEMCMLRRKD